MLVWVFFFLNVKSIDQAFMDFFWGGAGSEDVCLGLGGSRRHLIWLKCLCVFICNIGFHVLKIWLCVA